MPSLDPSLPPPPPFFLCKVLNKVCPAISAVPLSIVSPANGHSASHSPHSKHPRTLSPDRHQNQVSRRPQARCLQSRWRSRWTPCSPPHTTTSKSPRNCRTAVTGRHLKSSCTEALQLGTQRRGHLETGGRGGDAEWAGPTSACGS